MGSTRKDDGELCTAAILGLHQLRNTLGNIANEAVQYAQKGQRQDG
jgi:hypothetical protein